METNKLGSALAGGMTALIGIALVAGMAQAYTPSPPELIYVCPVCDEAFATYDELYAHFTGEHPAQPIEIIWD